jgi:hypothetical protein
MVSRKQRLRTFAKRLESAADANTLAAALDLLGTTLNDVEDEFSGVPSNPLLWKSDGRLYPPQEDSGRSVPDRPSLRRYRSVGHNTFLGQNGAIRIETLAGALILDKPGADGRRAFDLDEPQTQ